MFEKLSTFLLILGIFAFLIQPDLKAYLGFVPTLPSVAKSAKLLDAHSGPDANGRASSS